MTSTTQKRNLVAHYVMYLHDFFLEDSIASIAPFVDKILIARTVKPWFGSNTDTKDTDRVLSSLQSTYGDKIEIHTGLFTDEQSQRNHLVQISRQRGDRGAFIIDCDEIFLEGAMPTILHYISQNAPEALRLPYLTFIRYANLCVAPPYETGLFYIDLSNDVRFTWARACNASPEILDSKYPLIAHMSYIRETDNDILTKIRTFMHSGDTDWEVWFDRYYRNFDSRMKNFHPVAPEAWGELKQFDTRKFPVSLQNKLICTGKYNDLSDGHPTWQSPQELHDIAIQLVSEHKNQHAILVLKRIIIDYPDYTPALNDLALLLYDTGDKTTALHHLELINKKTPGRNSILMNLANLYCELGNFDKAIDSCQEIVSLNPNDPQMLVNLGNLNCLAGSRQPAIYWYEQALSIDPENELANKALSMLAQQSSLAANY